MLPLNSSTVFFCLLLFGCYYSGLHFLFFCNMNNSTLVLAIGDVHIPDRASDIPDRFKKLLLPGKIQHVLCTGNAGPETIQYFRSFCADVVAVAGNTSFGGGNPSDFHILEVGQMRVGLIHGHQLTPWSDPESLAAFARRIGVDILISGQSMKFEAFEYEGKFFLQPGSVKMPRFNRVTLLRQRAHTAVG